ncbi:MAG: PAS-domain containing protein [Hyphomonadaceae bacterium]|nr:PAS-domain containing protein [Hyphomonadaceae bacterium]
MRNRGWRFERACVEGSFAAYLAAAGSAAIGIAALLWALRVTDGARGAMARFKDRAHELEDKLARADAIFGAHPGVVLIWEEPQGPRDEGDWGDPRLYGSPLALASLLRFSDSAVAAEAQVRILQGLSGFEAQDATGGYTRLATAVARLRREGAPFSLRISTPGGVFIEVDGRTAGARAVVWILDASVRGVEESGARGRLEEARQVIARDPAAFLEMLSAAPFLAWRVSGAGKLEWANAAYLEALEAKSLDQAIARNLALDTASNEQARRVIDSGQTNEEVRYSVIRGERRALRIVMAPVAGGAAGVAIDVTEGETARDALSRQATAHDETLNHLAEGVAVFGPDKRLVFHNRAFAEIWGLEPSFLADRPSHAALLDHLKEKRKLPAHANYAEWRADELALYQEVADLPEALWVLPEGRTLRIARQRHPLGGLLLVFSDITNELALRTRYNALVAVQKAAIENLHEAVAVFGLDGKLKLRNSAFKAMWELEDELPETDVPFDQLVEACEKLFHDRTVWAKIRARITDPSPEARQEYRGDMRRSDGSQLTFTTRPLPDGQTLVAFLDVTAAKRVEGALRDRAEAFEAADRLKTEFVQNVSYQLRNPLHGVLFSAEMLQAKLFGPLNDRQDEQVGAILEATRELEKLISNILDVAMVEAGEVELELSDVDVFAALTEAAQFAHSKAGDSEVRVVVEADPSIGALYADEKRVKQILFNLVSNAMRHSERGGIVTLTGERLDGVMRLKVSDTGAGIPYDEQARAFDAFRTGDHHGAGLGLALVRSFVDLHGGWVALESEPGRGTVVTVHLPVRAATPSLPRDPGPENSGPGSPGTAKRPWTEEVREKKPASGGPGR